MAPKADPKAKAKADAKPKPKVKKEDKEEEEKNKVPQPDWDAHDKAVKKVNDDIEKLTKKKEHLKEQIQQRTGGKDEHAAKRTELNTQISELTGKINELMGQKDKLDQDMNSQKEKSRQERAELNKEKKSIGFTDEKAIDQRIADIEWSLQTGSVPLREEKKLVQEIQMLKRNRPKVAGLNAKEASLSNPQGMSREALKESKDAIMGEVKYYRDERTKLYDQLNELKAMRDSQMGPVKELYTDRDEISKQIQWKIQERNELKEQYRQEERAYKDYQAELRRARAAKADEERKQRQKEYEIQKKQREVDKLDEQPHVAEMTLIEQTIKFCRSLVTEKGEKKEEEKKEIVHNNPEGSEVLLRKDQRDEEFYFAPTKGKKAKSKNKGGSSEGTGKSIKHNAATFSLFDKLKLDAPLTTEEVPALLEQLEAKLEVYKEKVKEWEQNREAKKKEIQEGMAQLEAKQAADAAEKEEEEEAKTEE